MADTVTMPKLGFDMAEGTLVRWVIAEGEKVTKGAVLAEIETDKATVEVESAYEGVVRKHLVGEGSVVPVGQAIAVIGSPDEKVDVEAQAVGQASAPSDGGKPVVIPQAAPTASVAPAAEEGLYERLRVSPLARRMADVQGVDLRLLHGSGPGGRIVKRDIEAALQGVKPTPAATPSLQVPPSAVATPAQAVAAKALPPVAPLVTEPVPADQTVPLTRLRAIIGRRMVEAKQQVPHIYLTHEYDMAALMELRSQVNRLLGEGEKVTVNDFILKAAALGLRQYPNLNATLTDQGVLLHGHVNIGVAVALEGGLLTVVCRDADRKPLRLISSEVRAMADRARQGKVRPEDIEGSTFSISNLGMFDIAHFTAVINPPEAAILAIGAVRQVPVVEDGEIHPGMRMQATLSVDHRVSDGAEGARFLQVVAQYLEEPLRLMV
jgi:pyruvate dehydrogenase E2 component (dihydrolipoamide acetyltransferase)